MEQSQILQAKLEHQIQQITLLNQQLSSTNYDLHNANLQIVALQNDNGLLRKKIELMEQTVNALNLRIAEDAKYIDDLKKQNHHYDKQQEQKQQGPTVIEINNNEFKVLQELNTQLLGLNHELNDKVHSLQLKNESYQLDIQNIQQQNVHLEELLKRKESFINNLEQKFDTRSQQQQNEINNLQQQIASQKQQMFLKQSVNLEEGDPLLIEHYKQLYLELRQKYQELERQVYSNESERVVSQPNQQRVRTQEEQQQEKQQNYRSSQLKTVQSQISYQSQQYDVDQAAHNLMRQSD